MSLVRRSLVAAGSTGAALAASGAFAATGTALDTAGVLAQLGEVETAVMAVGGGIIALAAIAMGFRWIKAGIFG